MRSRLVVLSDPADAYRVWVLLQRTLFAKIAVAVILLASVLGLGSGWAVAILNAEIGNGPPGTPIALSPINQVRQSRLVV